MRSLPLWLTPRSSVGIVLLAALIVTAGCGTRVSKERIEVASGLGGATVTPSVSRVTTDGAGAAIPRQARAAAPAEGAAANSELPAVDGAVASSVGGTTPGPDTGISGAGTAPRGADVAVPTDGTSPVGATPAPAKATCTRALAPVILGQTAPASGIIGAATANVRSGLALWARAVNATGGLACHPVQLHQMDDGADPARVTANLTALVKNKGVVAIVAPSVPTTFAAARQFAERNKIPFVGGDLIEPGWFASPYLFPQGGTPFAAYAGALKEGAKGVGGKKAGLLYCVEAAACGQINEHFEAMVAAAGLEFILRKVTSITAPDYTAECQAMKSAGVEVLFLAMEGASDSRAARSCRALGYEPAVAVGAISVSETVSADANLRAMGLYLGTGNAPFLATDTAGARAFRAAYERFAPGSSIDQNSIYAWTSGKLLEAAVAKVADRAAAGPLTTEVILEGLWRIKHETLDGLAAGITFTRNGLPKPSDCYYVLTIGQDGYKAPRGSTVTCLQGLPRGF